jgi:NAD(P)-dependent dehydrogenase (short-subunit alcohol dehydrogenase family)
MATNATSAFLGAASEMAKRGGGSIVNISSILGFIGGAYRHLRFCAAMGAVRIFTKSAAVRFGPSGMRVNSVHPDYLPPMLNNTNAAGRACKAVTPLRRLGDVMDQISFYSAISIALSTCMSG